jgi:hypothetical protein
MCYLWEMALNFSFDASSDNIKDWKGIRKQGELIV